MGSGDFWPRCAAAAAAAAAAVAAVRVWDSLVAPRLWARRLRASATDEPCVLDVCRENVACFRRGGVDLIQKDLRASGLPTYVVEYVEALLIARGADQAFRTKTELVNFKKVVLHLQNLYEAAEADASIFSAMVYVSHEDREGGGQGPSQRKKDVKILKDLDECRGTLHALRDVRTWTAAICKVPRFPSKERLFLASDVEIRHIPAEMKAPGGLKGRLDALRSRLQQRSANMQEIVSQEGWPPPCAGSAQEAAGGGGKKQLCAQCNLGFGRKWLHGGLCWMCRETLAESGRCRFSKNDGKLCRVCPHAKRCMACEDVSCAACGFLLLSSLDDGLVSFLLDQEPAMKHLFVDWDGTLSSTSSGGAFVVDKHGLSAEVSAACANRSWRTTVVTRQNFSNRGAIEKVLALAGLDHVQVVCLGGLAYKPSKASVMLPMIQRSAAGSCVFLDDSRKELLDPLLCEETRIVRILCSPADWRPLQRR